MPMCPCTIKVTKKRSVDLLLILYIGLSRADCAKTELSILTKFVVHSNPKPPSSTGAISDKPYNARSHFHREYGDRISKTIVLKFIETSQPHGGSEWDFLSRF